MQRLEYFGYPLNVCCTGTEKGDTAKNGSYAGNHSENITETPKNFVTYFTEHESNLLNFFLSIHEVLMKSKQYLHEKHYHLTW